MTTPCAMERRQSAVALLSRYRTIALLGIVLLVAIISLSPPRVSAQTGGEPPEEAGRETRPLKPFDVIRKPGAVPDDALAIRISPNFLLLYAGGREISRMPFDASGRVVPFEDVVKALNRPDLIEQTEAGVFVLKAALIQAEGTSVRYGAPNVIELRLANDPYLFLGGYGATALFEDVTVTSWDIPTGRPMTDAGADRPFLLFEDGSNFSIIRSEIAFLGADRESGYGVSWRKDGVTGNVLDSKLHDNFFGLYTYQAKDMVIARNEFYRNAVYGVDPHDYSSNLVVEQNKVYENGSHGIVFSVGVVDSFVRENHVYENRGNGIVMDANSERNLISNNIVENNRKDGLVALNSGGSSFVNNTVTGPHRAALRANGKGDGTVFRENTVSGSTIGLQVYDGQVNAHAQGNVFDDISTTGMLFESTGSEVSGGRLTGSPIGIDVRSGTLRVANIEMSDVGRGILVDSRAEFTLEGANIVATSAGGFFEEKARVTVTNTRVRGPFAFRGPFTDGGGNDLPVTVDEEPSGGGNGSSALGIVIIALAVGVAGLFVAASLLAASRRRKAATVALKVKEKDTVASRP